MIIVNGLPKSGTHAVMAWFSGIGLQRRPGTILAAPDGLRAEGCDLESIRRDQRPLMFVLAHVPASRELWGKVVTVFRDPRNVLVSYCRHREREDCYRPTIAEAIQDFWGQAFVPLYDSYLGWRGRSAVLHYEDLPSSQVGDGRYLYASERRDWNTRTGSPSNWHDVWNDEAERAWQDNGGPELLIRAGYADRSGGADDGISEMIDRFKEEAA